MSRATIPAKNSKLPKTASSLRDEIQFRTVQHGAVAHMLETLFIASSEAAQDGERHRTEPLFEGLAVVARWFERDCEDVSAMRDELARALDWDDAEAFAESLRENAAKQRRRGAR